MAQNFLPVLRDQPFLLPQDMREWLPPDHQVWFVLETVEGLDLRALLADYRQDGWGRAAFHPRMMVALLLYSYLNGVRSSRGIERRCRDDIAFRVICANHTPDHATIARFMRRHEDGLKGLFLQVLKLCAAAGLVKVGVVAIDGTKMEANASHSKNYDSKRLEKLIEKIFEEAKAIDEEESRLYGDKRGDELPEHLADPEQRRKELEKARRRLENTDEAAKKAKEIFDQNQAAEQALYGQKLKEWEERKTSGKWTGGRKPLPPNEKKKKRKLMVNITDLDAKTMLSNKNFVTGYNAQVIATPDHIVLATELTSSASDKSQLAKMISQLKENLKACGIEDRTDTMLADAGYFSRANVNLENSPDLLIAVTKKGSDELNPTIHQESAKAMLRKFEDPKKKELYKQRSQMIEPIFANTKVNRQAPRFLRRGLSRCSTEWSLLMTTHNLSKLRLARLISSLLRRAFPIFVPAAA